MEYTCKNCGWKGETLSEQSKGAMWDDKCPMCGDEVSPKPVRKEEPVKEKNMFDLTGDGKVGEGDFSLAAKVLARSRGRKKKVTKK
jgi:NAD-dependent SIR2 family protein deacetylase